MPAAVAIPAAIAGGTSLISSLLGSRAAGKAAQYQQQAAETGRADLSTAGTKAVGDFQTGASSANKTLADVFALISGGTDPYTSLGREGATTLADFMKPGGRLDTPFSFGADQFQTDPGYQFRLNEGEKALQASAAARGVLGTSGTLKAITQYGQNFASNEYQNAYTRALNSFQTNQDNTRANLAAMINPGLQATGIYSNAAQAFGSQSGANLMNLGILTGNTGLDVAKARTDLLTGGANARAAGTIGSANAWGSGLSGVGNAALWAGSMMNGQPPSNGPAGYDPGTYRPPGWNLPAPTMTLPSILPPPTVGAYPMR